MDRDIAAYYISGKEIVKHVRESLDFSQDIFVLVERFNNQREQVAIASKAGETAGRSVNVETFMIGKLSVLDLNDSQIRNDESRCDYINQLFEGISVEEVEMMNKLHDMIIACRKDYEYGYAHDIEIVKITYNVSVYSLHEMVNLCVLIYTRKMRTDAGIKFDFRKEKKKNILLLNNVKGLLRNYSSGQWGNLMREFRKNPALLTASAPATEAGPINVIVDSGNTGEMISRGVKGVITFGKNLPLPVKIIIGAIALFIVVRALIYYFYQAARGVKDEIRSNKEFVDFTVAQEREDGAPDKVISKHTKLSERLESVANFIEVKLLKQNAAAEKELQESNQSNFQASDFKNPSFGGDITF